MSWGSKSMSIMLLELSRNRINLMLSLQAWQRDSRGYDDTAFQQLDIGKKLVATLCAVCGAQGL